MKLFNRIKKLFRLLDTIDDISFDSNNDQYVLSFKKNVMFGTEGSIVFKSGQHTVIKTGTKDTGLLFLNPVLETSDNVDKIVSDSIADHRRKSSLNASKQNAPKDGPCGL